MERVHVHSALSYKLSMFKKTAYMMSYPARRIALQISVLVLFRKFD